jgi:hypothetical protein
MTNEFWADRYSWPNDPRGYVFLARVVDELGKALNGSAWTGEEYLIEFPDQLPVEMPRHTYDQQDGYALLKERRPDLNLPPANKWNTPQVSLTADQWAAAVAVNKAMTDEVRPSFQRKAILEAEIARLCEAGELKSWYRPKPGGELSPIPPSWWNTEMYRNRFVVCQMHPRDPYGIGFGGEDFAWIFVSRESLERCVSLLPHKEMAAVQGHLSPYLRMMLSVARSLEITVDNQPKKEIVVEQLRKSWSGKVPLSAKLVDAMATLLREPESQLGRARNKKNEDRNS